MRALIVGVALSAFIAGGLAVLGGLGGNQAADQAEPTNSVVQEETPQGFIRL